MGNVMKKAILRSFEKMLWEKPLSKITIEDITKDCGISRTTFYYHFQNIYDLIGWAFNEEAKKITDGKLSCRTWQNGLLAIFNTIEKNRNFIFNVYHSVSREQVENFLLQISFDTIKNFLDDNSKGMDVPEDYKVFISNFYKHAFVGLVLDWIKGGMEQKPQDIVDMMVKVTKFREKFN